MFREEGANTTWKVKMVFQVGWLLLPAKLRDEERPRIVKEAGWSGRRARVSVRRPKFYWKSRSMAPPVESHS